MVMDRAKEQAR